MPDLWPDELFKQKQPEDTPTAILQEQADILTEKSKGLLTGVVEVTNLTPHSVKDEQLGEMVASTLLTLRIGVQGIPHYYYTLARVVTSLLSDYPVRALAAFTEDGAKEKVECDSADKLREFLAKLFASDLTKKVVSDLLSAASKKA